MAETQAQGLIGWFTRHRVLPNLIMIFLLLGGFYSATHIKQEVFPEFEPEMVTVQVLYPGASPEEVELGIVLALENAVRGLDGIDEVTATVQEGLALLNLELLKDASRDRVFQDIKQAVDRITTLPAEAEKPQVSMLGRQREVLSLVIYGDASEHVLRELAETTRDRLQATDAISQVQLLGGREFQIHVELRHETLRAHNLSLEEVARRIRLSAIDLPAGTLETNGGDLNLRIKDRRQWAEEFAQLPIINTPQGGLLTLGDLADVDEGFEQKNAYTYYNGKPSVILQVFQIGDQTPIGVSGAVRKTMQELSTTLPSGIGWAIQTDRSDIYEQRLNLLLKNAFYGLILVVTMLGVFLNLRLAFWVTMGIPISFAGALLFLPLFDVSINMISMFAFILALGIVVDDAIVSSENIFEFQQRGQGFLDAAIAGARIVSAPISFSVMTTVVAFVPIFFLPGWMGQLWRSVPVVVITVLSVSWFESLLILPSHLSHPAGWIFQFLERGPVRKVQQGASRILQNFVQRRYLPALRLCLRWPLATVATAIACVLITFGFIAGGRIGIIPFPRVEADAAVVTAVLPYGSALQEIEEVRGKLLRGIEKVQKDNSEHELVQGVFSSIQLNKIEVQAFLPPPDQRPLNTTEVTKAWREAVGPLVGLESLRFEADRGGPGSGSALTVELSHRDTPTLEKASAHLAKTLAELAYVRDVDDGYDLGAEQLNFRLNAAGASLGLRSEDIARQVRNAYFGAMALRQQRDRHETRVLVRHIKEERQLEHNLENLLIRAPNGKDVPLFEVASVTRGRAYNTIFRRDARRILNVTADVQPLGKLQDVMRTLQQDVFPKLDREFPGLSYGFQGHQKEMRESFGSLFSGFLIALVGIYFLLALAFRSYTTPLVIQLSIPFGLVGAILGHLALGYDVSTLSMMGFIALAGILVNDAIVLVEYTESRTRAGVELGQAILEAGDRRFRAVMLTSLTTFGGLAPMIFETSRQAKFLIPMAISLGFGILFATAITLLLVPTAYLLLENTRRRFGTS